MSSKSKLLASGALLRTLVLIGNIVSAFILMPFIIHSIGEHWYGLWVIVGALMGYYGLLDFGLGNASSRFTAKALHTNNPEDIHYAVSTSIGIFIIIGLIALFISALIIMAAPVFFSSEEDIEIFRTVILIMGCKVAISFPFISFFGIISAKLRYDIVSYTTLFKITLRFVLFYAYISHGYSIIALALITLITELLGYITIAFFAIKLVPGMKIKHKYFNLDLLKQYIKYGKFAFLTSIGDILRFRIDELVIAKFLLLSTVTHYAVALRLIEYAGQFMTSILGIFTPVFTEYHTKGDYKAIREKFLFLVEISSMLSIFIGSILIILGENFIKLWMGVKFIDSYIPLVILVIGSVVAQSSRPCIPILYAINKHKYYAYMTLIEAFANFTLSIILIQYLGMVGVALGTALPAIITKIYFQPRYTCREIKMQFSNYYRLVAKYIIYSTPLPLIFYLFNHQYPADTYSLLLIYGFLFSIAYFLITLKFILSENTKETLLSVIPTQLHKVYKVLT